MGYDVEDPATKPWKLESIWGAGAHLMGRVTYEDMVAVWPTSTSDYAQPMNEIPRVGPVGGLQRLREHHLVASDESEQRLRAG
jgi:hypothetical protein